MLHIQRALTSTDADKVQFLTTTNLFGTPAQPNVKENVGVSDDGSNCLDAPMNNKLICHCGGKNVSEL